MLIRKLFKIKRIGNEILVGHHLIPFTSNLVDDASAYLRSIGYKVMYHYYPIDHPTNTLECINI